MNKILLKITNALSNQDGVYNITLTGKKINNIETDTFYYYYKNNKHAINVSPLKNNNEKFNISFYSFIDNKFTKVEEIIY